jgi:hypothetical protein
MKKKNYKAPQCESLTIDTGSFIALSVEKGTIPPVSNPGDVRSRDFETPTFTWRKMSEDKQ